MTGIYDASCAVYNNMLIAMSPDAYVTAIAMGRSIGLFNTENGSLEEFLEDVHGGTCSEETKIENSNSLHCLNSIYRSFLTVDYTIIDIQSI